MKLWKYYSRKKTNLVPECVVRCVGSYPNGYVVQFEDKHVEFVSKNHESLKRLYSPVILRITENE